MTKAVKLQTLVSKFLGSGLDSRVAAYATRLQSGRAKCGPYTLMLCPSGTPDNMAVLHDGRVLWMEVKDERDRLSIEQRNTLATFARLGHLAAIICRDDDAEIRRLSREVEKWAMYGVAVVPFGELAIWLATQQGGLCESGQTTDD